MPRVNAAPNPALVIEPLESRSLFAGITLHSHMLEIVGIGPHANTESVGLNPGGTSIFAKLSYNTPKGAVALVENFDLNPANPRNRIGIIKMVGGNGNDYLYVDQTYGSFSIRTHLFGGGGNDTLTGGDEPDSIQGGSGNDYLSGGDGNDTIYGGRGNDTLIGGPGNNYLNGGLNHDYEVGGAGNDTLADAYGPDTMYGGGGVNIFFVSVIGQAKTDFVRGVDHAVLVSITTPSDSSSWWKDIIPFGWLL